ncbi:hypothetical protein CN514_00935 [Bacillus sp. AFS001701]|uniref:hypothetical protein n=1 Tax=Bacillus sp. AFS001701 TaxID=2033480 RepID=UPI000BF3E2BC|nr:hypothetical protein [Bacillus sp. AFS001701]PET77592.1 hypothetical protein CN514_00935 [Bacillus sp. AFS001701]
MRTDAKAVFYKYTRVSDGIGGTTKGPEQIVFTGYGCLSNVENPRNQKTTRVNITKEAKFFLKGVQPPNDVDFVVINGERFKIADIENFGKVTSYTLGNGSHVTL